jgi:hypothetical protein
VTLSWLSVDARTGQILADLPDLSVQSVRQLLGAYSSSMGSLPIPTAPEGWERATLHGGAVMVLVDDPGDGTTPTPLWGGLVTQRTRGSGDAVDLSLATLEAAMDRVYVGAETFTGVGQNAIVEALVVEYMAPTWPITVVKLDGDGTARDRAYSDADDKTLLSVVSELSGVQGGPEWTVGWQWLHNPERIVPVLYVGSRVGASPGAGFAPAATFEMPGSVVQAQFVEDFSAGKGATDVMAVSSATAGVRPQSPRQTSGDTERPAFEYRWTPSTSITNVPTLTSHAQSALSALRYGSRALTLTADMGTAPALNRDWWLGDDVGYQIGGVGADGRDTVPAFPGGLSGTARAIGWELDLRGVPTVAPILQAAEWGA